MLERSVIQNMMSSVEGRDGGLKPLDNLTYKTFVKKFNSTYKDLNEEQRELLNHYILSFSNNSIGLKVFMNEELGRLKGAIKESLEKDEIKLDSDMSEKTNKVLNIMKEYKTEQISENMIKQVLKIQELVREIQN